VRRVTPIVLAISAASLASCLGHGTQRIDAPCREMRSAVAYEMLKDNPSIPIVDVRRQWELSEEGRVKNAIAIPLERLPARAAELQRFRETTVIVLGRDEESGRLACQMLSARGFKYVLFVSDGAEGWFKNRPPSAAPFTGATTPTPTPTPTPK
jgi:rhodanese-related sulfurtransferase